MDSMPLNFVLLQLMKHAQLPDLKGYDTQMVMHSATSTDDTILYQQLKNLLNELLKHGVIDKDKYKNG